MFALAINKQLDLQTLLIVAGRCLATIHGWYESRRVVQSEFMLGIIAAIVLAFVWVIVWIRDTLRRTFVTLLGLVFVATFGLIRAINFNHIDAMFGYQLTSIPMNWVLELTGPIVVIASALHDNQTH